MHFTTPRLVGFVCGLMLCIVLVQAALPTPAAQTPPPPPAPVTCIGDPIPVDYVFTGWNQPHACAVQCEDDQPRYILYSDGKAAQCQTPPGCNDEGEDRGILCEPALTSTR